MKWANMAKLLEKPTIEHIAHHIRDNCKKIIVLTGAGISTSSGIPDFRTPGTGLYSNLEKYRLPYPEAIFDLGYFRKRPEPFYTLAKELYPGNYAPTLTHYFIKLLAEKKLLVRNYTQNIDALERLAGIPGELLVEAHGAFNDAHCIQCRRKHSHEFVREKVFADQILRCHSCQCLVKPDIVFFGEALPDRFHELSMTDFNECDLLIVMGTSLQVGPFNRLVTFAPAHAPRLLINLEDPGLFFNWRAPNHRDVKFLGKSDDGCHELAKLLGWADELLALRDEGLAKLRENPDYKLQGAHHHHEPRPSVSRAGASARGGREIVFAPSSSESEESEEEGSDAEMSGEEARDKPLTNAGSAVEQLEAGLKGVSVSKFKSGRCIK